MPQPSLQFWYEFASTYSYLSVCRIEQVTANAGIDVEWKPFLLGPIVKEFGWNDSVFNLYPIKGRYMWRDLERLCEQYGIPYQKPTAFPRNGLYAARIATIAAEEGWCPAFTKAVFQSNFADDEDISAPPVLSGILESIGEDTSSVMEQAQTQENKDRLRKHTELASSLGIFGAPCFIANGELFWGNDRLEQAVDWLKEKG